MSMSWTHRLARIAIRPLIGSAITPNHLTSLRLATGVLACAALLPGDPGWDDFAGGLWLVSAFLDRADGELARVAGLSSRAGHIYDYVADNLVNAGFFVALGIGLGDDAIPLGIWTGVAIFVCGHWSEQLERQEGGGSKAYSGAYGFDPDDGLYLLAPALWLDCNAPLLLASCVVATAMMLLTGWRLRRHGARVLE